MVYHHIVCFSTRLLLALVLLGWGLNVTAALPRDTPIVAACKADLAKRLAIKVDAIQQLEKQAVTWPDASLGMPEIDMMYAQVETPGWKIVLEARNSQYLYTASAKTFKYGGPVPIWSASLLYLQPAPDEPNLNGDLYQCSLLGTNNLRLATGVTDYYPQADGFVLFTRRTSRSSHELLLVNAKNPEETTTLHAAFAFGEAALCAATGEWAAYVRPRVGAGWIILVSGPDDDEPRTLPLPDGVAPGQIAWSGDTLMILGKRGDNQVCYAFADTLEWKEAPVHTFPGVKSYMLNKSESLEVTEVVKDGKASVEIARVWFTGDRNVIATIDGLSLRGHELLVLRGYDHQPMRYLFIRGDAASYTVDIATGEVIPGLHDAGHDIKPFTWAPASPPYKIVMGD